MPFPDGICTLPGGKVLTVHLSQKLGRPGRPVNFPSYGYQMREILSARYQGATRSAETV